MNDKTITTGQFDRAVSTLIKKRGSYSEVREEMAISDVNAVLVATGITVEPAPILPDVTGGEWEPERDDVCDDWDIWGTFKTGPRRRIAYQITNHADAKVMAGSKELVELVMLAARAIRNNYSNLNKEWRAIIDQLEKTMGVDVSEFKADEDDCS